MSNNDSSHTWSPDGWKAGSPSAISGDPNSDLRVRPRQKHWTQRPAVLSGVATGAIGFALYRIRKAGQDTPYRQLSQRTMEARVVAQGAVVLGLMGISIYQLSKLFKEEKEHEHDSHH